MKSTLTTRLAELLKVKSIVTLILTAVFAVLTLCGRATQDFMTVYAVIIAFYFGIQSAKDSTRTKEENDGNIGL